MSQFAQVGRFVLRDIEPWEGPGLFAMTGDRHVTKYMGFKVHDSVDDATLLMSAESCPTKAILLFDKDGKQAFPA